MNMAIELRLTEALEQAKWEQPGNLMTRHLIQPLGTALCDDSEVLARAVFREVQVRKSGTESGQASPTNVDAVLVPGLASVERDLPADPFGLQTTTMQVTWTLLDRNGKVLWATTVTGEGTGPVGMFFDKDAGITNMGNALQDAFRKSAAEIASAPLIQQYAAHAVKPAAQ